VIKEISRRTKVKIKSIVITAVIVIAAGIGLILLLSGGKTGSSLTETAGKSGSKEKKILYWRAPMNPNEVYDHPGKSKMGMDLVPVYEDEGGAEGVVRIDPAIVQNMNIKTTVVKMKDLSSQVITNGILTTNEEREYIVTTRVNGWVEKLYVNYTGRVVDKGEKLMDIYSPELVAAEQELLTALSYQNSVKNSGISDVTSSSDDLLKNAVRKLELLEISDKEIERLKETKEVKTYVTLYAQKSGTVIHKNIIEGQKIMAGEPLLRIVDLSNLWLTADIYEYELSKVKLGSPADITFNFLPGKSFTGRISFIYPTLDDKTRTAKVRFDIPNYNNELKPSMYANIVIHGTDMGDYPVIPEQAVLRSGQRNILIVALGGGKFKPVDVMLGGYSEGYYQVLKGIAAGDTIVTSAQFLIDSESNLKAALSQFTGSSKKDTMQMNEKNDMKMESGGKSDMKEDHKNEDPRIRKGKIDLKAIDKNNDGKLYEDIMDWNVISDEPGVCPLCGMTLREFTIDRVKKNLKEHEFEYK
jgi:Cu(I)/Ag(I) efflux system membrane fusion protein